MNAYLLDTHVWAWATKNDSQLPGRVANRLVDAQAIHISAITFYEICQKVRLGKWPEMEEFASDLLPVLHEQDGQLVEVTGEISQLAGALDWPHRDPFDRMIAATSILLKIPLVSADTAFDALDWRADWPGRVW